jgi:hypothetical protein
MRSVGTRADSTTPADSRVRDIIAAARAVQRANESAADCEDCADVLCVAHGDEWADAMSAINGALFRFDRAQARAGNAPAPEPRRAAKPPASAPPAPAKEGPRA